MTAREVSTLQHTMEVFKYTHKAATFMKPLLNRPKAPTSYYRQIAGARYDRELLTMAEEFVRDGQISYSEAHQLWKAAQDGKGVTETERRTLLHTLEKLKYTPKASKFLHGELCKVKGAEAQDVEMSQQPGSGAAEEPTMQSNSRERLTLKWKWVKVPGSSFPAFPVVLPKKEHRFSLVMCHPMGCYSTFFLGPEGLVKDLLIHSRQIRNHCKILCPGARHIGWGKQWFRYRTNRGGTNRCHAEVISTRDLQRAVDFVSGVVQSEVTKLGSPDQVLLGGYSQGGCISLAVGLSLSFDLGLVMSQRGMLMQQTIDAHTPKSADPGKLEDGDVVGAKPRVLMTAGVLDDVYLLANQKEGKAWLERHGCEVDFRPIETLDHYENSHEEHALIRKACLAAFSRARQRMQKCGKK
eukprot:TRINITY_DN28871_c0_g1_i1.p1 TRINITY_DN28871_c0_g1~~TRINITY_DN28871_c0_g1_i1.p1  ORF type:complete len:468 (-),score=108.75 TRINITY_DN28871_c0_g1_i1:29-1258(-)